MKSNQEILDEFGRELIENTFDPAIGNLLSLSVKENPPIIFENYVNFLKKLKHQDFITLQKYLQESVGGILFNILKLFEENEQFKLIYEENGKQINLVEISEMLKAEPIIENGWIKRFSKYADEYDG
ncbi:conserved hypothetical protein [Capnocytophaga canimorsus]|uniref:Uncharacterized protein n=1 Tax=Capnocytophaga canimorsus TaxID=28188 RepID=A0A0B7H7A0_9FLAO|nr:hypothetical protein [Capnocytophaga canimorsus]ATA76482.1 hypothetical protein CGC47_02165 [Capnocytophaga canimorsus]PJI75995.1 hypothetical protein CLV61_2093 [Capnocytophaga canimorsus]CEN33787.1 conserved hypothetical protein [Capnocytophaga canimorsus]STA71632.1 Uncharacterised protein [Capnocytophaga canimorsus]